MNLLLKFLIIFFGEKLGKLKNRKFHLNYFNKFSIFIHQTIIACIFWLGKIFLLKYLLELFDYQKIRVLGYLGANFVEIKN